MLATLPAVRALVEAELPITLTQVVIIAGVVVLAFGAVFCAVAFKGTPRQLYRCRRCDREFSRAAHRPFPARCPHCKATDWQA